MCCTMHVFDALNATIAGAAAAARVYLCCPPFHSASFSVVCTVLCTLHFSRKLRIVFKIQSSVQNLQTRREFGVTVHEAFENSS